LIGPFHTNDPDRVVRRKFGREGEGVFELGRRYQRPTTAKSGDLASVIARSQDWKFI
jgi:hypothetical protein